MIPFMAKRGGKAHLATIRRHYKGKEYSSTLLRRSYREDGKVKNETVGNLSHLPPETIDVLRRSLADARLVDLDEDFEIVRSLPHGHAAAVLGVLRELDLERLLGRERCRERDLCVAMIAQRLLHAGPKLSTTRLVHQSTLADLRCLGEVKEAELLSAMDWLLPSQERIEKALACRQLKGEGSFSTTCPRATSRAATASSARSATRATASAGRCRSPTGCAARPRAARCRSRSTPATPPTRHRC
jgi:hypothetical protein